jgi:hypothetical protein
MQSRIKQIFVLFLLITFFLGLYMYVSNGLLSNKMTDSNVTKNGEPINDTCPNLLVRKDNKYYLKYSDDKINPIVFNNLSEYVEYLEKQRKSGRRCPVLYLQKENDTQGKDIYKVRPSPLEPNRGISTSPYIYLDTSSYSTVDSSESFNLPSLKTANYSSSTLLSNERIKNIENFDINQIINGLKELNKKPGTQFTSAESAPLAPPAAAPPAPPAPPAEPPAPAPAAPAPPAPAPAAPAPPAEPAADPNSAEKTPPSSKQETTSEPQKKAVEVKDASRSYPPYNSGQYNGFDSHGQYIGEYTNIDEIHDSTEKQIISDNPMDTNWGGVLYTQQAIDTGKYDENNVYRSSYYTPKNGQFYPFAVNNTLVPPPPSPVTPAYPSKVNTN